MRILIVSPALPHRPSHDAARLVVSQLIDHLSARHTIGVVAASGPADTAAARAWLAARAAPVELVAVDRWRRPLSGRPDHGLRTLAAAVRRASLAFEPDVVHLQSAVLAPLARVATAPCVLACHESPPARGPARAPGWQRLRARLAERRDRDWARAWFDGVSACVVDSQHDRRATSAYLPDDRLDVIAPGIDADRYPYRRIGAPARLVFTGDLGVPGDLEAARRLALAILPAVRRRMPRTELLVASTGTADPARELGRLEGVRVEGRLADLRPTVWGAAVYVSAAGTGAGRTARLLEALALGTPIVATAASLSRLDAVVPGHHVLTADGDGELVDAISLLMREPVVANTIARNARELVEQSLTWRAVAERYDDVYHRVGKLTTALAA